MKYENISFNERWVAAKTFAEFMEHEKHHGLSREQMKEVHTLCKAKHSSPAHPEKASLPGRRKGHKTGGG